MKFLSSILKKLKFVNKRPLQANISSDFECLILFYKVGQPLPLFVYFCSLQTQYYRKTVGFSGIRTRIVGVEGEHTNHLITTTAQGWLILYSHCYTCSSLNVSNLFNHQ